MNYYYTYLLCLHQSRKTHVAAIKEVVLRQLEISSSVSLWNINIRLNYNRISKMFTQRIKNQKIHYVNIEILRSKISEKQKLSASFACFMTRDTIIHPIYKTVCIHKKVVSSTCLGRIFTLHEMYSLGHSCKVIHNVSVVQTVLFQR